MNKTRCITLLLFFAAAAWAQGLKEFSIQPADSMGSFHNSLQAAEVTADRIALRDLIAFAYGLPPVRVLGPRWLDDNYRVAAKASADAEGQFLAAFERVLVEHLHLRVERSAKEMPVYVLTLTKQDSPKMHSSLGPSSISGQDGAVSFVNAPMSDVDNLLARTFGRPVVDETGLQGAYTFDLEWQTGDLESLMKTIREQLGLTLVDDRRKLDVLMVERTR